MAKTSVYRFLLLSGFLSLSSQQLHRTPQTSCAILHNLHYSRTSADYKYEPAIYPRRRNPDFLHAYPNAQDLMFSRMFVRFIRYETNNPEEFRKYLDLFRFLGYAVLLLLVVIGGIIIFLLILQKQPYLIGRNLAIFDELIEPTINSLISKELN